MLVSGRAVLYREPALAAVWIAVTFGAADALYKQSIIAACRWNARNRLLPGLVSIENAARAERPVRFAEMKPDPAQRGTQRIMSRLTRWPAHQSPIIAGRLENVDS